MGDKPDCNKCTVWGLICQWPLAGRAHICQLCIALKLKCEISRVPQSNKWLCKDTREGTRPSKKPKTHPLFTLDLENGAPTSPLAQPPITTPQWGKLIALPMPPEKSMVELVGALNNLQMQVLLLNVTLVEQAKRDIRQTVAWD